MVVSFGELLLRISPSAEEQNGRHPFLMYMGGAEANTATALAGWNIPVKYCTALPENFMSAHIIKYLQSRNIDTSSILYAGNRVGLYYLDRGADLKSSVIYDRELSAFSELKPGAIDWDYIFKGVSWFNLSAISPALNQNLADVCLEAVKAASLKKITVSFDLNYRSRLWNYGRQPADIIPAIVQHCDLVMGNIWAAQTLLKTSLDASIHEKGTTADYLNHAKTTSLEIMEKFPQCQTVANTFRFDTDASNLLYYTSLFTNGRQYNSPEYRASTVIDRSGSGDCYMAGLIYGLHQRHEPQDIVNFATAAAFGKLQEQGDTTDNDIFTVTELGM